MTDKQDNNSATKEPDEIKPANTEKPAVKHKPAKKAAAKSGARMGFYQLLTSLAVLGVILTAAAGYYLWLWQEEKHAAIFNELRQVNSQTTKNNEQRNLLRSTIDNKLNNLQQNQQNLSESFAALLNTSSHLRNDWLITEAEYLIKLANHRLLLERDITTAIVAMQAADERLREVADPGLINIRKHITNDINKLRAVPQADISGMSFELSSLSQDIEKLPLITPDPASIIRRTEQKKGDRKVETWQDLPNAVWQDLKSLIVIREHANPIQPLLSPEQHFFLTQNLRLQMEQARLALLNGHDKVFKERLAANSKWVDDYFDKKDELTQHVLKRLSELAKAEIKPPLPDLSNTYRVLRDYRTSQQSSRLKPINKPAPKTVKKPEQKEEAKPAANPVKTEANEVKPASGDTPQ